MSELSANPQKKEDPNEESDHQKCESQHNDSVHKMIEKKFKCDKCPYKTVYEEQISKDVAWSFYQQNH